MGEALISRNVGTGEFQSVFSFSPKEYNLFYFAFSLSPNKKGAVFPDCTLPFSSDGNHAIMRSHFQYCHFKTHSQARRRWLCAHLDWCSCFLLFSFFILTFLCQFVTIFFILPDFLSLVLFYLVFGYFFLALLLQKKIKLCLSRQIKIFSLANAECVCWAKTASIAGNC